MLADGRFPAEELTLTMQPSPRAAHARERRADGAQVAHDVQLPERVPVGVLELLEADLHREADVVDEAVDTPELRLGPPDELARCIGVGEVAGDADRGARLLADALDPVGIAAGDDDLRPFLDEHPGGRLADAGGRAGDDADATREPEIHPAEPIGQRSGT